MSWYKNITVELPLFLAFFGFLLVSSILPNFIIYRTCYVLLGYNESDCALLGRVSNNFTRNLEKNVQPTSNIVSMAIEMPTAVIPVFICIYAGPWSDKHGRKPIQLLTLAGFTLWMTVFGILSYFKNLSPWYFIFASIPTMLTGSAPTYFAVVLAYLNDIATDNTRALRMAVFEAVILIGLLTGTLSSAPVLYATSYETVFFLAAGLLALSTLYTLFFLPETVKTKDNQQSSLSELTKCSYMVDLVKVLFKERENYNRSIILFIVASMTMINFISSGENVVRFPFLREKFGWTLVKNNYFTCFFQIITIVGTIGGTIFLNRKLGIRETVITLMGLIGCVGNSFLRGFATNDYFIFVGSIVAILSGAPTPLLRSRIAQIVPSEEMGKIFSLISALSSIVGIAASYLYTTIYNATISINSGTFNFVSGSWYLFAIFLVSIVLVFEMSNPKKKYKLNLMDNEKKNFKQYETNPKYTERQI